MKPFTIISSYTAIFNGKTALRGLVHSIDYLLMTEKLKLSKNMKTSEGTQKA